MSQSKNNSAIKSNQKSLEDVDFTNLADKISSPRSKKAIFALGIDERKLYQISKKDYISTHPEQEEKRKKEVLERQKKLEEQEKKYNETKMKNESLIEKRRKELLKKFTENEKKTEKQKEENHRLMTERLFEKSIHREDNSYNVERYNKQLEYRKMLKEIEERQRRIAEIQRQKLEMAEAKRQQQEELKLRKTRMLSEVNILLRSGGYKSKEEIYQKVFSEEELREINNNQSTGPSYNNSKENYKTEPKEEEKKNDDVFLTQQQ